MTTITTTEARIALSQTLARFRAHGVAAEPLVFGDHRRPEGVVLPYETFIQLEDAIDQLRLDAASALMTRMERVITAPETAVKVARRHRRG